MDTTQTSSSNAPNQAPAKIVRLGTCHLCKRRKMKCDRDDPCARCVQAGIPCTRSPPVKLPRGRQGGRRKVESELLKRVSKLESMIRESQTSGPASGFPSVVDEQPSSSVPAQGTEPESRRPTTVSHPTLKRANSYLAPSVWTTLGDEVAGMREVLEASSDSEAEDQLGQLPSQSPPQPGSFQVMLNLPSPSDSVALQEPSVALTRILCDVFIANVDCVFKILHAPYLRDYLYGYSETLPCSPGPKGLLSLKFSIYYAAVTSLTQEECFSRIGDSRDILLKWFRQCLERAFAEEDLLNTEALSTLQALVLFLAAVRSNENHRLSWTLTGLAVRIAQALCLHRESWSPPTTPLLVEMRRRLWWAICQMDFVSAGDRGTDRAIAPNSYDTPLPLHVNDSDLTTNMTELGSNRSEFTDMTFPLTTYSIFEAVRSLNEVSPNTATIDQLMIKDVWSHRREMVISCRRHIEDTYLRHCDPSKPFHRLVCMVADAINAMLWIMLYRPLQRRPKDSAAIEVPYPGILLLATEALERFYYTMADPQVASIFWYSRLFLQWHPLAVVLAELCVQVDGPVVERAWKVVMPLFEILREVIADGSTGRLWKPIKKLMLRAQHVRHAHLQRLGVMEDSTTKPPLQKRRSSGYASAQNTQPSGRIAETHSVLYEHGQSVSPPAPEPRTSANQYSWLGDNMLIGEECGASTMEEISWMNWISFIDDMNQEPSPPT